VAKLIDETGKRYGKLIVVERADNAAKGQARWLCRCDCGNTTIVIGRKLRRGYTRSCGCFRPEGPSPVLKDETGKRYARLMVIERAGTHSSGCAMWLCQCDCGNIATVNGAYLRNGTTESCGCLANRLPKGEAAFNALLCSYQCKARDRGLDWDIDETLFRQLTSGDCHYCGAPPAQVIHREHRNGHYKYNGIDRMDNSRGYVPGNVVPCCGLCNWMKGTIDYRDFVQQLDEIAAYRWTGARLDEQPK